MTVISPGCSCPGGAAKPGVRAKKTIKPLEGRHKMGKNAINKLMQALTDINKHFDQLKITYSDYFPTVNVGFIQGGQSVNQVPEHAEAKLDIRYPFPLNSTQITREVEKIIEKYPDISLETLIEGAARQENLHQMPFDRFKALSKKMYNIDVESIKSDGASDARFFGEKQIPVLVISPVGGEIHSDAEWIDLEDLYRFYQVMKAWVIEMNAA